MTQTLTDAVARVSKLPTAEQQALAQLLLDEIASEARWTESFARSQGLLATLANEALAELRAGETEPLQMR